MIPLKLTVFPHTSGACICVKVILYNFFGDSTLDNLWKYLTDEGENKLTESKYAPLIHEVSDSVRF